MKSVAPSLRPGPATAAASSSAGRRSRARSRRGSSAPRAAAGRSGSSQHGGSPGQPLAPVGELAPPGPRRAASCRCQTAKSAYCTGSSGRGEGRPAAKAAIERRQLAQQHPQRPAVARRCGAGSAAARARSRPSRSSAHAQQRPAAEVERPAAPPRRRGGGPPPRARSGQRRQVHQGQRAGGRRRITCTGRPSRAAKTVRSASWRRTTSPSARARAATSSAPVEPQRRRDVVGGRARLELVEEPEALLGERQRQIALPRRPGRAAAAATRAGRRRRLDPRRPAPPPSAPRRDRAAAARPRSASRSRDSTRVASSEWPPRSKKLSSRPDPLDAAAPPPRSRPAAPRPACAARRSPPRRRPRSRRAGQRLAVHLAVGVSGSAASTTKAAGTM